MPGYWWECDGTDRHRVRSFSDATGGLPIVRFFFHLCEDDWDQSLLSRPCAQCSGLLRINYSFPRRDDPLQFAVQHVVGLLVKLDRGEAAYLPMLWESIAVGESESKFDLKYVGQDAAGNYQPYGLARPAIVDRGALKQLADLYRAKTGVNLL